MERQWVTGILIGVVFVISIIAFGYNSDNTSFTGSSFHTRISQIKGDINNTKSSVREEASCMGGPRKQGTCSSGYLCSAKTGGVCNIKQPIPTQTQRGSCPNCLVSDKAYQEYELSNDAADLYETIDDANPRLSAHVVKLKAINTLENQGFKAGVGPSYTDTNTIFIAFSEEGSLIKLYKLENNKALKFDSWSTYPEASKGGFKPYDFLIYYKNNYIPVEVNCVERQANNRLSGSYCRLYRLFIHDFGLQGRYLSNLTVDFRQDTFGANYLGHADSGLTNGGVMYRMTSDPVNFEVSSNKNDILLPSKIVVLKPSDNAAANRIKFRVPPEHGIKPIEIY